jgi:hypothetical protein
MKNCALTLAVLISLWCFPLAAADNPTNGVSRVPVVFSGGFETDPKDGGRPVALIAGALGVPTEVFREAFSHVRPAPAGTEPEAGQVRQNKAALLSALGKYGVTNERLDQVSNYYRYVRSRGERWPARTAVAQAVVKDGVITGFEISSGGSGYSSPPSISVPNLKVPATRVDLVFGPGFQTNGSVASITISPKK